MILQDKPTYSKTEAAKYIRVGESCLDDLVASGEIAAAKPGREYVFRRSVLDAYLERLEAEQTAQRREAFLEGRKVHIPTEVSLVRGKRKTPPQLPEITSPESRREVASA